MGLTILPSEIYRPKMSEASYTLMREEGTRAFGLFLHRVRVRATNDSVNGRIAAIGLAEDGEFDLFLHWPTMDAFPRDVFREILKHEILHPVHGHVGQRWKNLCGKYTQEIANYGADLVVNQHIKTALMEKIGIKPLTVERFAKLDPRFKPNMTTSQYADLFAQPNDKVGEWLASRPKIKEIVIKVCDGKIEDIDDLFGQILESITGERAEAQAIKIIEQIKAEMEVKGFGMGRGWESADTSEMIEQSKRVSPMSWQDKMKTLVSKFRAEERVATKLRPSRRHPEHFGRVRHNKLKLWFGVDSSGSMGTQELEVIQPELEAILNHGEVEITLLHVDAELKYQKKFERGDQLVEFFGRAGTDFSPFLLALQDTDPDDYPHLMIYYTDGEGCISRYVEKVIEQKGADWWAKFAECYRDHTPEGIPILWLLAEGRRPPEDFREVTPFGEIAVLPIERITT